MSILMFKMSLALLHALEATALWQAPIHSWLLAVSAWARRATALWAVLPPSVIAFFDKIASQISHLASLLAYRVMSWLTQAFVAQTRAGVPIDPPTQLPSGPFLENPGLGIGLAAAAMVLVAVRLHRRREPAHLGPIAHEGGAPR
jgi:hypothetical protein